MLGVARPIAVIFVALSLSGCWEATAIELGGRLVIAGIGVIADATSESEDTSSASSSQAVAARPADNRYCRRAGTNQAYMNSAVHCKAGDTPITSTEFFSSSTVIVSPNASEARASYCYDSKIQLAYQRPSENCGSDQIISKEQYDRFREELQKKNAAKAAAVVAYCLVSGDEEPYRAESGRCEPGHKRITAEQFETEMAKFGGPDTYCYDKAAKLEYKGSGGKCLSRDVRISAKAFEDSKKKRAATYERPKAVAAIAPAAPDANSGPAVAPDTPQQIASIEALFVVPPIPPSATPVGTGTAFYVSSDGYALTNQHVVDGCKWMGLAGGDGIEPAAVIGLDSDIDLALLRTASGTKSAAKFSRSLPEVGEANYVVGYPLFATLGEMNITDGIVSSLSGPGGYSAVLQTSAPMQPGNSGGPVFGDTGLVIGVAIARLKNEQAENVNFAIKAEHALAFLSRHGVTPKSAEAGKVRTPKEIAKGARAFTFPAICFD